MIGGIGELLADIEESGGWVVAEGGEVVLYAPAGAIGPELLAGLRTNREAIGAYLQCIPDPPPDMREDVSQIISLLEHADAEAWLRELFADKELDTAGNVEGPDGRAWHIPTTARRLMTNLGNGSERERGELADFRRAMLGPGRWFADDCPDWLPAAFDEIPGKRK